MGLKAGSIMSRLSWATRPRILARVMAMTRRRSPKRAMARSVGRSTNEAGSAVTSAQLVGSILARSANPLTVLGVTPAASSRRR